MAQCVRATVQTILIHRVRVRVPHMVRQVNVPLANQVTITMWGGIELSLYDQYSLGCPGGGPFGQKTFIFQQGALLENRTPDFFAATPILNSLCYSAIVIKVVEMCAFI